MTEPELLAARSETFGGVFILVQYLSRLSDAALEDWGLTTRQWLLLAVLARGFPGRSPSLTDAAEVYGSSRQNVKQIALGLQAHGFVRLAADPSDGRTTLLELTGKERMFDTPEGLARSRALFDRAFAGLSAADALALRGLIGRWLAGLAEEWRAAARREGMETDR